MKRTTLIFLWLLLAGALGRGHAQSTTAARTEHPRLRGEGQARVSLDLAQTASVAARQHLELGPAGARPRAGQPQGLLTLQPLRIALNNPLPFISVIPVWHGQNLQPGNLGLEMRSSADGRSWSAWEKTGFEGHADDDATRRVGKMEQLAATAAYVQFRVVLNPVGSVPTLRRLEVLFYSPGETPATGQEQAADAANRVTATCAKPAVTSRAGWGARTPTGTRSYTTVTHLVVHHEAGSNTSSDWAARVRSIETLHINGNGWADIGYNYLVDPNGVIYEGRSGGDNVVGAHFCAGNANTMAVCMLGDYTSVGPTAAARESLRRILAWKASKEGIDPTGSANHYTAGLIKNVCGHRDNGGCSACPGNTLYGQLPALRTDIQSYINANCGSTPPADTQAPTTSITGPGGASGAFTATFADADNVGVAARFYQPLEWRTNEWRANRGNGFYNDNFGTGALHPDYVAGLADWQGSWSETAAGTLRQSDVAATNTALSTFLSQTSGNTYLYQVAAKVNSTSGTRRFGLHIMASDAGLRERGNSYLVWFSLDQQTVSVIETINNVLTPRVSAPLALAAGAFADYKVLYSTGTGTLQVFRNNALVASWTDATPLTSGAHISLRTGTCDVEFDDLKVYKSRGTTATVTVGAANTNDVRTAGTPGCKIKSLAKDAAHNWSAPGNLDVNITLPAARNSTARALAVAYPNPVGPADQQLTLAYALPMAGEVRIVLFDAQGTAVKSWKRQEAAGTHEAAIAARELTRPGLYFVQLTAPDGLKQLIRVQKE